MLADISLLTLFDPIPDIKEQQSLPSKKLVYTEAYLGHRKKNILPGQDNYAIICPGKIIILSGQDNRTLSCPGKIIIFSHVLNTLP